MSVTSNISSFVRAVTNILTIRETQEERDARWQQEDKDFIAKVNNLIPDNEDDAKECARNFIDGRIVEIAEETDCVSHIKAVLDKTKLDRSTKEELLHWTGGTRTLAIADITPDPAIDTKAFPIS